MLRGSKTWRSRFPVGPLFSALCLTYGLRRQYARDMANSGPLSAYWDAHQIRESDNPAAPDSPLDSPVSLRFRPNGDRPYSLPRNRAFSDALVLETPRPALTPFHPASSLPDFIDCFGPLIFPLYRAALLRKRILLLAEAPVHMPCNYGAPPLSLSRKPLLTSSSI